MAGVTDLWLFVVAGFLLNVTPGPDMAFIMARSAQGGWPAGAAAALGVGAGTFVHIAAAAVGLSALLAASATAFTIVKLIGAAYLVWMGIAMLRGSGRHVAAGSSAPGRGTLAIFGQGFLTNALNPKVALFFLAFLPQFIAAGAANKAWAFVSLGLIFDLVGTAWNLLVAWAAARAAALAGAESAVRLWLERSLGVSFVGLGLKLALAQRNP